MKNAVKCMGVDLAEKGKDKTVIVVSTPSGENLFYDLWENKEQIIEEKIQHEMNENILDEEENEE